MGLTRTLLCTYRTARLIAGGLVVALALTGAACKTDHTVAAKQNRTGEDAKAPRRVKTVRVTEQVIERTVTANGTLAAYDQATLSTKVPGRLYSISVDFGSVVHRGQKIAEVEPQDYQLRVKQAEAAVAQARARLGLPPEGTDDRIDPLQTSSVKQAAALLEESRTHRERWVKLFEQGLIAPADLDAAEASYKVALSRYQDAIEEIRNRQAMLAQRRSELDLARQQLADSAVHVPFDGIVQERRVSVGEYLAAGAPIVTIVRMDPLRLRAEVPEREAHRVRIGQKVRVAIEGDPNGYSGRIMRLSPVITAQNRMLVVEAEVRNNGSLRPGAFVRADIVTDEQSKAVIVPKNALLTFAGIEKVITVQGGKAVEKPVTTGRSTEDATEIISGLKIGDAVVTNPGNLQTGQPVTVTD